MDRILLGLLERDFLDFSRVGSLKRIAKPLLTKVLHYSEKEGNGNDSEALELLKEMKAEEDSSRRFSIKEGCIDHIAAAIQDLEANINRTNVLLESRVLGVTCAATNFPLFDNSNCFNVIIMVSWQCYVLALSALF